MPSFPAPTEAFAAMGVPGWNWPRVLSPHMVAAALKSWLDPAKNLREQRVELCRVKLQRLGDVCYHSVT